MHLDLAAEEGVVLGSKEMHDRLMSTCVVALWNTGSSNVMDRIKLESDQQVIKTSSVSHLVSLGSKFSCVEAWIRIHANHLPHS